ncbi:ABC transporter substrate-binding protein [Streptomyces sp. NP160]|nr:ABC transporter substrate-binding protein [Streptomyces sp. NP160]
MSAALVALTACGGSNAGGATPSTAGGASGSDDHIVYAHQQEPPCVFGGWIEQAYLSTQVLDALVSLDADHRVVPWLADSWESSADGLTWTFHLKDGVSFTDGSPLTAQAVAYNFDYWVQGGNSTAAVWLAGYYDSAEAVDSQTLRIHLSRPYPRLAETLTQGYFGIQSQKALTERTAEENCAAPIGTGAFVVDHWTRGQEIVLTRNEEYTSPPANAQHTGPAYVKTLEWRFVPDGTTRVSSLQAGEVDAIYDVPAIDWKGLGEGGYQQLKYVTPGRPQQISFTTTTGPFTDERVRKAFAYSLDRKSLVDTIGRGLIPYEGNGGVSQTTPGYSQEVADAYSFDLPKAEELLQQAGWTGTDPDGVRTKDGQRLTVRFPYATGTIIAADGATILQGVAEQARAAGFDVQLIPVPPSGFWSGLYSTAEERDLSAGYWTSVTAGILWINWRPTTADAPNHNNSAFYDDPVLADLITRANSTSDVAAQNALYAQAQEYIADHALSIGVYDRISTLAVSPRLKGVWQENAQGGPVFYDAHFTR